MDNKFRFFFFFNYILAIIAMLLSIGIIGVLYYVAFHFITKFL